MIEKDYSELEVRKQILETRGFLRGSLLDRENAIEEKNKITFDLTYYPIFQNLKKKIFTELHLLLIFDVAHKTFFKNMQIITFKNDTSLKGQLF